MLVQQMPPLRTEMWKQELVKAAIDAASYAYMPYSNYRVGAALLIAGTQDKPQIIKGCNVENASYPCGCCAEKSAVSVAVSQGLRKFDAVAVVTKDGGSPCGQCRQTLNEFNPQMHVIMAKLDGTICVECQLSELLPHGFGPANLL